MRQYASFRKKESGLAMSVDGTFVPVGSFYGVTIEMRGTDVGGVPESYSSNLLPGQDVLELIPRVIGRGYRHAALEFLGMSDGEISRVKDALRDS
mgnify:CR=1 FL=1